MDLASKPKFLEIFEDLRSGVRGSPQCNVDIWGEDASFLDCPIAHCPVGTVEYARKILDGIYKRLGVLVLFEFVFKSAPGFFSCIL